jgi:hypothetical protein
MDLRAKVFSFNPVQRKVLKIEKKVSESETEVLEFLIKCPTARERDQIVEALKAGTDKTVKSPTLAMATATVLCTYDVKDADKRVFSDADVELFMNQPDSGVIMLIGQEVFELMNDSENQAKKL